MLTNPDVDLASIFNQTALEVTNDTNRNLDNDQNELLFLHENSAIQN